MSKFKVGDMVKAKVNWCAVKFGNTYKVAEVLGDAVRVHVDGGMTNFLNDGEFELVPAFKVGDRVRMKRHVDNRKADCGATVIINEGSSFHPILLKFDARQDWAHDGIGKVDRGHGWWVKADAIEMLPAPVALAWVPKIGDRVIVLDNKNNAGVAMDDVFHVGGTYTITASGGFDDSWTLDNKGRFLWGKQIAPAAPLQIESGKFYRTRDGRKVGPMTLESNERYFSGRIAGDISRSFELGGNHINNSHLDLVALWQDAPAGHSTVGAQVDTLAEEYGPVIPAAPTTAKPKFKVGDRVVCLESYGIAGQFTAGKTYVVSGVYGDSEYARINVTKDDSGSTGNGWSASKFAQAPTTAIVCLIKDGQPKPASPPFVHTSLESAAAEAKRLANIHVGKEFGVFALTGDIAKVEKAYDHEWQKLAANGNKIGAIKELRGITGMGLKPAKDAVEYFLDAA